MNTRDGWTDGRTEKISVALGGGGAANAQLLWVAQRARRARLNVDLIVVDESHHSDAAVTSSAHRDRLRGSLRAAKCFLSDRPGIDAVTTSLLVGSPLDELEHSAAGSGLLVVGTHAVDPVLSSLGQSLALRLAARALWPLAVIPSTWRAAEGRVVVGVDDDASSDGALAAATEEARVSGRGLVVVHAWTTGSVLPRHRPSAKLEFAHRRVLDGAVERIRASAPGVHLSRDLDFGRAGAALQARARPGNVIFLGSHHRGAAGTFVLGSVCREMLLAPHCPIMIVPAIR